MNQGKVIAKDINGDEHEVAVDALRWRPSAYAVIVKDGAVLTLPAFGGYALPGGGIDLGESIEQGLCREVKEETGLAIGNLRLVGAESSFFVLPGQSKKGNNIQSILLYYRCDATGELTSEYFDENEKEYGGFPEWLPITQLGTIKLASSIDWRKYVGQIT